MLVSIRRLDRELTPPEPDSWKDLVADDRRGEPAAQGIGLGLVMADDQNTLHDRSPQEAHFQENSTQDRGRHGFFSASCHACSSFRHRADLSGLPQASYSAIRLRIASGISGA